ncbi:unnamed protein product [Arabidopsis lyrata]|nr:unnamed protein product [Arabidopsis lyrata]
MGLTISRQNCNTPSFFSEIPNDLLIKIVSRLPLEDLARCRCVSKQWASVLSRDLTNYSTSPRILFTFHLNGKWVFFSTPQALNTDQNLTTDYHMCFQTRDCSHEICPPVCGLICNRDRGLMICNPSTGEYKTLPNPTWMKSKMRIFFGYDPVGKQYKVLCLLVCEKSRIQKAKVLTLGTGKLSWRKIECYRVRRDNVLPTCCAICISGVLYFQAEARILVSIDCFYLRSEKFEFIIPPLVNENKWNRTPINYKGKLGVLYSNLYSGIAESIDSGRTESIELRVLEDPEEGKWSRHIYIFPPIWKNLVAQEYFLCVVGMTHSGEIVFSSYFPSDPFYVLRYNVERNTIIKVEIQRLGSRKGSEIFTFIDHVENVKHI